MSSAIWTPTALSSEARPYGGKGWRLVEAQHRVSTLRLVDTLAEQALLEAVLEETKPPMPAECTGLDYLLGAADHLAAQGRNVGPMLYRDLLSIYALGGQGLASTGQAEDYALSEFDHVDQAALECVNEAVTLAVKRKDQDALAEIARTAAMVSLRWRGFAQRRAEE